MTEGEKKVSFKVVDRRRFTEEGDERTGPDVPQADPVRNDAPKAQAAPPKPPANEAAAKADKPKQPEQSANGLTFSMFIQSLAQQALMQLGLIPWPHGQRELALDQARDTIDIVELLKLKTKGNLSAEEQQLLDTVSYELKMSFVEVQQAIARSRGGVKPPPGIQR